MKLSLLASAAVVALSGVTEAFHDLQRFKVQTQVIAGNKKFNGLYAYLYHTGAGTADITFSSNKTIAFDAFLNHTQFQWDYSGVQNIPFATNLEYQTYAAWGPVGVNPGYGDYSGTGYKFTGAKKNIISDTYEEWVGWLVCDWWHQVPELFWLQIDNDLTLIDTCAKVNLVAVNP